MPARRSATATPLRGGGSSKLGSEIQQSKLSIINGIGKVLQPSQSTNTPHSTSEYTQDTYDGEPDEPTILVRNTDS